MITFDDFKKVELRIAKIIAAERVEGSEKLLKLQVDLGDHQRQVIAGIGKAHAPESLTGKQIVIVANLEPRNLMGLESNGMLLAASPEPVEGAANSETGPVLLMPEKDVAPGTEIR